MRQFIKQFTAVAEEAYRAGRKLIYTSSSKLPWSTGYSEYKYDFIAGRLTDPGFMNAFRAGELPAGYGAGLDERVVEYPWFLTKLKDDETVLLDAGSVLNHPQILKTGILNSRKLHIMTLAYERYLDMAPFPSYLFGDLRDTCFRNGYFDAICCLSTLEHIGMDNTMLYTADRLRKESDRESYLVAAIEFRRILRDGGTAYISVPYGKHQDFGWFQVFDEAMVDGLVAAFAPSRVEKSYFRYHAGQWSLSDAESCGNCGFFDIHREKRHDGKSPAAAESVVCLKLVKQDRYHGRPDQI